MIVLWILLAALGVAFLLVVLRGAPYVPTHRSAVNVAIGMLDLPKGATIVDLGSGDGIFLKAAAERGYRVVGYEINPFLCLVSYIRCWRYRNMVSIRWRDFWLTPLPHDTKGVFVFQAGPFLRKLHRKLSSERTGRLLVVSYGFLIPGADAPVRTEHALHLYKY